MHAEPTSGYEEGPPFETWWEDAVWPIPKGDWTISRGGSQILENRVHQEHGW